MLASGSAAFGFPKSAQYECQTVSTGITGRRLWCLACPNCFADCWLADSRSHDCPGGGALKHLLRFRTRLGLRLLAVCFTCRTFEPDPRYLALSARTLPDYKGTGGPSLSLTRVSLFSVRRRLRFFKNRAS